MSRVFIEGYETQNMARIDEKSAGGGEQIVSTAGLNMIGDYCLDASGAQEYAEYNVAAGGADLYGSLYWRNDQLSQYHDIFAVGDASAWFLEILTFSDGRIAAYRQGTGLQTSTLYPLSLTIKDTYFIEFYFSIADTGGRAVIKVDGVTCVDYTGDTKPGADSTITRVCLGRSTQSYFGNNRGYGFFDNVVLDNASYPGSTLILALPVSGAGTNTDWTPSTGSNWSCVDEIPYSKSDYNSTNSVNQTDTHALTNLPGSGYSIKCISVEAVVEQFGTPTPTNIAHAIRTYSTDYVGSDIALPTAGSEKTLATIWETNPNTAAAFTPTEIDALEIGYRSKT